MFWMSLDLTWEYEYYLIIFILPLKQEFCPLCALKIGEIIPEFHLPAVLIETMYITRTAVMVWSVQINRHYMTYIDTSIRKQWGHASRL